MKLYINKHEQNIRESVSILADVLGIINETTLDQLSGEHDILIDIKPSYYAQKEGMH